MDHFTGAGIDRRVALGAVLALAAGGPAAAQAAFVGPGTTIVDPDHVEWIAPLGAPPKSYETAVLVGDLNKPGPYVALLRWYPGYMSAPHTYLTDRMAFVLSGAWWVDSARDYRPERCHPIRPGTFIRRAAGSAHYDGVISAAGEPATIAMFGLGPVGLKWVDPATPPILRA